MFGLSTGSGEAVPHPWERAERLAITLIPLVIILTLLGTAALLFMPDVDPAARADVKMLSLGMAAFFAAIAVLFLARLIGSLESGDSLSVESHWGGLGGGVGGWRISRAAVYLICTVTFGALTAMSVSQYREIETKGEEKSRPSAASKKSEPAGATKKNETAGETPSTSTGTESTTTATTTTTTTDTAGQTQGSQ